MRHFKSLMATAAIALGAVALTSGAASASVLTVNTGWQYDQIDTAGGLSEGTPVTFDVAPGTVDTFSLTDGFIPGDSYTVTIDGLVTAFSTFTLYPTTFDNTTGPAAEYFSEPWTDSSYSHLQLTFNPGAYSLAIVGDGSGGTPAGFGYRLDTPMSAAPEPSTWALMFAGVAMAGGAMRFAKRRETTAALA